jgi:tRNA U34 5-methylaminomethyl-2-thiouridine-forming methyltransferase MnmC
MVSKKLKLILTEDGSHTLLNQNINEHYHSTFGAIQESMHIFIRSGLEYAGQSLKSINLLEIGFGTGLNTLLAMQWADENKTFIEYTAVEAYPLPSETVEKLNYTDLLNFNIDTILKIHYESATRIELSEYFSIQLLIGRIQEIIFPAEHFSTVFFDAFSPDVQPEMWIKDVFHKIAASMKRGGVLTTYSTKGTVKQALKDAGFEIEKLPGPVGKREILRAVKK